MKKISTTLKFSCSTLVGCGLLIVGCSREARDDAGDTYEEAVETTQTVADDTREWFASTWQTAGEYTSEQRKAFVQNLRKATETVNERAETYYETASDETVNAYKTTQDTMRERLAAASEAGDESWEETKSAVQEAWRDLKTATENLLDSDAPSEEIY